jgi:hypothetical protein
MSGVMANWRDGRALPMLYTGFASVVTLCSAVGMAAHTAAGVYNSQHSRLYDQAYHRLQPPATPSATTPTHPCSLLQQLKVR